MPLEQAQLFFGREDTADAIQVDQDPASAHEGGITGRRGPRLVGDWTQRRVVLGALNVERTRCSSCCC
jgi:lipoprotein-releasing system permease protein